jgi:predicted GH43/DUF377 family glycosyl hydrolase
MTVKLSDVLTREGLLLAPDPARPDEAGGVLNPTAYQVGGRTWLMYRAVAQFPENFSRLALAELVVEGGKVVAKRHTRFALEPTAPYELLTPAPGEITSPGGGCEDPRVTDIDGTLWLCYTGYGGERVPRIAIAKSQDGLEWERLGLARFSLLIADTPDGPLAVDLNQVDNKDAMLFPERINGRYAMLHRPMFPRAIADRICPRQSIWISYSDDLIHWTDHKLVAEPVEPWERLKLGGGSQPVRVKNGWLILYHGVAGDRDSDPNRRYSAGAMVLDAEDPSKVVFRSKQPMLTPDSAEERVGVVNNVVFPTALWPAPDGNGYLGAYGMADWCIGLARLPEAP